MYTSFFGLNEKPFSITPDPRYLLMSERHTEGLAHLLYGLVDDVRVLGANTGQSNLGTFTDRPETLSNDFFLNLLDMNTKWEKSQKCEHFFEGRDNSSGQVKWTGTAVDLVFGSNSQLRAIAEVYGADDALERFARDFVAAWTKVMDADRFDLLG